MLSHQLTQRFRRRVAAAPTLTRGLIGRTITRRVTDVGGTKLGRYEVIKHLANGGMAQVLLARATGIEGFERYVVVKRIHTERGSDPIFVQMFLDEARLAAQLHHTNIVQTHDIGQENGQYFFAMDYIHGEDLRKLLFELSKKKQKTPLNHLVSI